METSKKLVGIEFKRNFKNIFLWNSKQFHWYTKKIAFFWKILKIKIIAFVLVFFYEFSTIHTDDIFSKMFNMSRQIIPYTQIFIKKKSQGITNVPIIVKESP